MATVLEAATIPGSRWIVPPLTNAISVLPAGLGVNDDAQVLSPAAHVVSRSSAVPLSS